MESEKLPKQSTQTELLTYENFPLKPDLLVGMKDYGCLDPFLPQENILLPILEGKDLYAESRTSRKKTLAIIISALQRMESDKKNCQVLFILPTRALCHECMEKTQQIGKHMSDLNVFVVIGGVSLESERIKLQEGPSIIFGTPGRLLNTIQTGSLELKRLKLLIMDETDELLGRGFQEQILSILKFVPPDVQMAIISATTPIEVQDLVDLSLRDPVNIRAGPQYVDMEDVTHYKVSVGKEEEKIEFLVNFYKKNIESRHSVIYCKKMNDFDKLVGAFQKEKFPVTGVHYDVPEHERERDIRGFQGSSDGILVTVDSRFFDEIGCSPSMIRLIIHYDVPKKEEEYQKNFGTLRRFSRRQTAINLVGPDEVLNMKKIEKFYNIEVKDLPSDIMII